VNDTAPAARTTSHAARKIQRRRRTNSVQRANAEADADGSSEAIGFLRAEAAGEGREAPPRSAAT
jgi:hypothetical protein